MAIKHLPSPVRPLLLPEEESVEARTVVLVVSVVPWAGEDVPSLLAEATCRVLGAEHVRDVAMAGEHAVTITLGLESPEAARLADPALVPALEVEMSAALREAGYRRTSVAIASAGPPLSEPDRARGLWEDKLASLQRDAIRFAEDLSFRREIAELVERSGIRTVFQPIVVARGGQVAGYEALSRGPAGHRWERPDSLLEAAERAGLSSLVQFEMVRVARKTAMLRLNSSEHLLFINAPDTRFWPEGRPDPADEVSSLWPWNRTVSEVSERTPIPNNPVMWALRDRGRERGLRYALDDVGAGYAGLVALALLSPDYVKIDMAIIRDCDSDSAKQAVIIALIQYAKRSGALVIAEGVETDGELVTVRDLGVDFIQGFVIAPPAEVPTL